MPTERLCIVADDLTGAADSALPFWRAGHRVVVMFDPAAPWPDAADVLSLCTHSRAMSERAAHAAVAAVARRLPSASRLFKKIDSTLRGWIGAECLALLAAAPHRQPIFAPAYPTKGRTLGPDGIYRVHGVPLARTEFAPEITGLDPDSRLDGFVRRHFGAHAARVRLVASETNEALRAAVEANAEPALWIGSPGLGIALAGPKSLPGPPPPPGPLRPAPIVVAAGSRRSVTRRQVHALQTAAAESNHPQADLFQRLEIADAPFDPARSLALAHELGARAAAAARSQRTCGLILTGGDIAAATCRHLGIASAEIIGEVEDGLPVLRADNFLLVTKAGGFGDDLSLIRAHRRLAEFLA